MGPYCVARLTIDIPQRIKDNIHPPPLSPVSQGSQSTTSVKTQEELDVEKFEKEAEDSGIALEFSELELDGDEQDDSGIVP